MLSAEELIIRATQAPPTAPPTAPPPLPPPQPVVYMQPHKSSFSWLTFVLIVFLIVGAFFVGSSGLVSITDLAKAPAMAMNTPAPGANIAPTARIVLSNGYGVVTAVPQQQSPPLAQAAPTSLPVRIEATAAPAEIPIPNTANEAAPAVVPQAPAQVQNPAPVSNESAWSGPPANVAAPQTVQSGADIPWSGGGDTGGGGGGGSAAAPAPSIPVPSGSGGGGGSSGFD